MESTRCAGRRQKALCAEYLVLVVLRHTHCVEGRVERRVGVSGRGSPWWRGHAVRRCHQRALCVEYLLY